MIPRRKTLLFLLLLQGAPLASLQASLPVPPDLRNPFAPADPTINVDPTGPKAGPGGVAAVDKEREKRQQAIEKIKAKLLSLPILGVVEKPTDPGNSIVLLGGYTIRREMQLPASDFGVPNALIRIEAVDPDKISTVIAVDLENQKFVIPISR